jgi:hypothetical protein
MPGLKEHDQVIRSILPIWTRALRDESGATFGQVAAPHVRLEASIFAAPIEGRDKVWASLRAAGPSAQSLPSQPRWAGGLETLSARVSPTKPRGSRRPSRLSSEV